MRSKIVTAAALIGVAFLAGACASAEQWADWRGHTTHFASGDHGMFSMRNNMSGTNPRVTRLDVEAGDLGVPAVHIVREREHAVIAGCKVCGVAPPLSPLLGRGASAS